MRHRCKHSLMSAPDPSLTRIFVYGTLKRGCSNHHWLAGQQFIGEARTQPAFRMHDLGGFPGMMRPASDGLSIEGEVWDVDPECLARLDVLEGIAIGEYERVPVHLLPPFDRDSVQVYLWLLPVDGKSDAGTCWRE